MIHIPDPPAVTSRPTDERDAEPYERIDYYATPSVEAPVDGEYFGDLGEDGAVHEAVTDLADAVERISPVDSDYSLGGHAGTIGDSPEMEMAQAIAPGAPYDERWPIFDRLRGEYRVLLATDCDPATNLRVFFYMRLDDMAAGQWDTVGMQASYQH